MSGSPENSDKQMVRFVFKGDKFVHQTPICIDKLSLPALLERVSLSLDKSVPSARELFTDMFDTDIAPFVRALNSRRIKTKTQIAKLWDAQPMGMRKVFEARSTLLQTEWMRLKAARDEKLKSQHSTDDDEAARRRSEKKAKREAQSQRRKDLIAEQIANGLFDAYDPAPKPKSKPKPKKPKKPKVKKKAKVKVHKLSKKRIVNPIRKKPKPSEPIEEWPAMPRVRPKKSKSKSVDRIESESESLRSKAKQLKRSPRVSVRENKVVTSALRFRLLIQSDAAAESEWLEHWMDADQMDAVRRKVGGVRFVRRLRRVRVWLYMDMCGRFGGKCIDLVTDGQRVAMVSRGGSSGAVMLFELRWSAFGADFQNKLDADKVEAVFVKNTQTLRIDVPVRAE